MEKDFPERDYSLLRPFNPEAASRGDEIAYNRTCEAAALRRQYVAGPDQHGSICTKLLDQGLFALPAHTSCFRMAPLCWVEGKPVYKGDVLYRNYHGDPITYEVIVKELKQGYLYYEPYNNCPNPNSLIQKDGSVSDLSWQAPKQKREGWVNIYSSDTGVFTSRVHPTEQSARDSYGDDSVTSSMAENYKDTVRIEWEWVMPKNIHTPRQELICGQIDNLEDEIMKIGATHLLYLCHNIRFMAERMEKKLYEYKQAHLEGGHTPI